MPKKTSRRAKRSPEEGYKWGPGNRWQEKDPTHPRWNNISSSSDDDSDDDSEIARIVEHTSSANKRTRDTDLNGDTSSKKPKTVTPQLWEKVKDWSNAISVDTSSKEFGINLLGIAREFVHCNEYLIGAVKAMFEELSIQKTDSAVQLTKQMPQQMTPKGLRTVVVSANQGWDANAYFTSKQDGQSNLSYTAAASAKHRDVHRIQDAVKVCGTISHASVAVHHFVTKMEPQIGINLGVIRNPEEQTAVAADFLRQIVNELSSPRVHRKNTNDALSFQKTLFAAIMPPAPTANASELEKENHKVILKQIINQLGASGGMRHRVLGASREKRELMDADSETLMENKLIKVHRRKERSNKIATPEFLESFKDYLLTCEATYDSPNRNDCVFAKDLDGNRIKNEEKGVYVKARNRDYQRGLGWLYQCAIKPEEEGGFPGFRDDNGEICVSQTTMERMIPHNYKRMTNTLNASCRCSTCLVGEYLHEDLMSWRRQHMKNLEQETRAVLTWLEQNATLKNTREYTDQQSFLSALEQEKTHFAEDSFDAGADGKLTLNIKSMEEALDLMTCPKVGVDKKFHPYRCCIGRCGQCPKLPQNRGEHHSEGRLILWRKHEHRHWCKLHGAIEGGKCNECMSLPESNRPSEKPRKTYDPVKKTASIFSFLIDHYSKFNTDLYRQHCFLRRALGKNWCKKLRDPYVMLYVELHMKDVHTIWEFADRMECEYNNATMTEGMGGSAKNIGMEGCCYHMMDEDLEEVQRHWFGFLSDEKPQDARVCFVNRCRFIEEMQEMGKLTEGSTLWIQTDGCGKQYKCHNTMQMHILLSKMYKIKIDVMITTAGHGKCIVDSLGGIDKHHLDKGRISEMDPTRVDEHQRARSEAYKACVFLSSVDRMLGDYKHTRQTEDRFEVKSRKYAVTNYDATKTEVQSRSIPFKNTTFGPVGGWKTGKKNGIKEMFHFRFDYRVPGNTAMARRIPCACIHCTRALDLPWVGFDRDPEIGRAQLVPERVHPREQPSYQQPQQCVFREMMQCGDEDLNAWNFIDIAPIEDKCNEEELDDFFTTVMKKKTQETESEIVIGGFGALSAITNKKEHGIHIIQWTKKPHTLQSPSKVYGLREKVAAGRVVCEGAFWSRVDHSNDWYEPQETMSRKRPKKVLVLLSQVLSGKVCFKPYMAGVSFPPTAARVSKYNLHNMSRLIRLGPDELDYLQNEQQQREGFELTALDKIQKGKGHTNRRSWEEEDEFVDDSWVHPDY